MSVLDRLFPHRDRPSPIPFADLSEQLRTDADAFLFHINQRRPLVGESPATITRTRQLRETEARLRDLADAVDQGDIDAEQAIDSRNKLVKRRFPRQRDLVLEEAS